MAFDDILVATGGFSTYQHILTFGYLTLSHIQVAFICWTQIFILLIPPFHLKLFDNGTEWIHSSNESNQQETSDPCYTIQNQENETAYEVVYDFSLIFPTYSSENNLVCENAWKMYLVHTVYWSGNIFGTVIFGIINDKYGRRRAYQTAVIVSLTADVATYFCTKHVCFVISRFFSALGGASIVTMTFMLATEHCIPSKRRFNMFVSSITFAFASLAMVWLAYLVHDWRYVLMVTWLPSLISIIASYFIPESPSWLLTKGREIEAVEYVQRIARVNKKTINQDFIVYQLCKITDKKDLKNEEENVVTCYQTFLTVLKSSSLRRRILSLGILWMAIAGGYNGVVLQFQNLPYNMYISYSIGAMIEVPGMFFVMVTVDRLGRRWLNAGFLIAAGIVGIISGYVQSNILVITLGMIVRLCFSAAFDITFSYSNEVLPTEIRGRTVSFIRTCGGIGSTLAPFIVSLAQKDPLLPLLCFGILALFSGLLMLTLPETCHQHLPQTIEEGEKFGAEQSFWLCPFYHQIQPDKGKEAKKSKHLESFTNPAYVIEENQA